MKSTRLAGAVALVIVGLMAVGAAFYWFALRAVAVEVVVAAVGTVGEEIRAPGSVSSRTEVDVASRLAGVVAKVMVAEGDEVEEGQLLVALDDRELRGRAAGARAAAASAAHGRVVAEAALEKAQADLALARTTLARDEVLVQSGDLTRASLDATTTTLRAAEAAEKGARATLETRRDDARRLDEEAGVAETVASYAQIVSPLAGLVTLRDVEVGSTVAPGSVLFRIVDDEIVCVETRVDVSQMGRVAIGLPATVRLASGDELTGKVGRVAHEADPVTRDQEVRIRFDQPPSRLTLDEEAQVVIRLGDVPGLVVPGGAVLAHGTSNSVFVARDGRAMSVPVAVRAMGQGSVVIEGVTAGDLVVVDPTTVRVGQRVRPLVRED